MRTLHPCLVPALFASILIAMPALASNTGADKMKSCASSWNALPAVEKRATTYQQYSSDCLSGKTASATPASTRSSRQQERMKHCASEWDKMKAAGQTANMTYQEYSARCLKK